MTDRHPMTYWTSDRSVLVEEGDPRAAFLAYGPGDPITPEHLELLQTAASVESDEMEHDLYGSEDDAEPPKPAPKPAPVKPAAKPRATRKPKG